MKRLSVFEPEAKQRTGTLTDILTKESPSTSLRLLQSALYNLLPQYQEERAISRRRSKLHIVVYERIYTYTCENGACVTSWCTKCTLWLDKNVTVLSVYFSI